MDTTGEITVAIPSYNYAQYLTEAVMSAVEQEGVKLDVVIVDNASTDGSLHLARELAEQHDCVRVVAHPDNQGIVSSFNRCLDEVRGEYSVMLSADDCLAPGSLLRSARFMRANANVGLVYGPIVHFSSLSDLTPRQVTGRAREAIVYPGHDWIDRRCHVGTNPIRAPEAFVRTAARRKVGKYDPSFPFTFDLHMWLRLALISDVGYLPGPAQAFYRVHNLNFPRRHASAHRCPTSSSTGRSSHRSSISSMAQRRHNSGARSHVRHDLETGPLGSRACLRRATRLAEGRGGRRPARYGPPSLGRGLVEPRGTELERAPADRPPVGTFLPAIRHATRCGAAPGVTSTTSGTFALAYRHAPRATAGAPWDDLG